MLASPPPSSPVPAVLSKPPSRPASRGALSRPSSAASHGRLPSSATASHGRLPRPGSAATTRSLTRSASLTSSRPQWRGVQAQRKTEKSPTRIGADEFALGQRLAGAGEHEMAVKKFGAAIAALPADVRLYVARGESQCALGAHRRAVYDFSMAIRLEPEVAAHHRARGLAFVRLGQLTSLPGALHDYDTAVELTAAARSLSVCTALG